MHIFSVFLCNVEEKNVYKELWDGSFKWFSLGILWVFRKTRMNVTIRTTWITKFFVFMFDETYSQKSDTWSSLTQWAKEKKKVPLFAQIQNIFLRVHVTRLKLNELEKRTRKIVTSSTVFAVTFEYFPTILFCCMKFSRLSAANNNIYNEMQRLKLNGLPHIRKTTAK